jgi:hypothetical protein
MSGEHRCVDEATSSLGRAVLRQQASLRRGEVESGCIAVRASVVGRVSEHHGRMIKEREH